MHVYDRSRRLLKKVNVYGIAHISAYTPLQVQPCDVSYDASWGTNARRVFEGCAFRRGRSSAKKKISRLRRGVIIIAQVARLNF